MEAFIYHAVFFPSDTVFNEKNLKINPTTSVPHNFPVPHLFKVPTWEGGTTCYQWIEINRELHLHYLK